MDGKRFRTLRARGEFYFAADSTGKLVGSVAFTALPPP